MTAFLIYSAKTAVVLAAFYMFYRLLLSNEKMHKVNRIILLLTAIVSFVLPLCVITVHKIAPETASVAVEAGSMSVAGAPNAASTSLNWWIIAISSIYFLGAATVLARLVAAVVSTRCVIRDSQFIREEDGCQIYVSDKTTVPFSWIHSIVIPREDFESGNAEILAHEKAHVMLRHSMDILLVDILKAAQWFNPAIWMLRSDLAEIHEYQADDAVLSAGADVRNYQYLLVKKSLRNAGYTIVNSFNHSTLKNRINMMSKNNSSARGVLKALYVLPLVCLCLAANAKTVYVSAPQDIKVRSIDGKEPLYIVDGKKVKADKFKAIDPETIESINVLKDAAAMELYGEDGKDGVIVVVTRESAEKIAAGQPVPGKIEEVVVVSYGEKNDGQTDQTKPQRPVDYNTIDTKPQFNGGDSGVEFAKYIAEHTEYPQNCKWSKIEGRVLVSFIVNTEGKVTDVKVLRSSESPELDAEAVRVVKSSPKWTPAQQAGNPVPVTFTFPVEFKLR